MAKEKDYLKLQRRAAWGLEKGTDKYHPIPLGSDGSGLMTQASGENVVLLKQGIDEIINQLKIINTHLAFITDEVVEGEFNSVN